MAKFDFSTLNSSDFEDFFCDLLNAKEKNRHSDFTYRTFKEGKDQGIDILYSTYENDHAHVVQVKHMFGTGVVGLISSLKSEAKKVQKLNPDKYIVGTSVDLGVGKAKEIKGIFHPYIKTLSDIYGLKDINNLLNDHPEVLRNHFKLWFSGTEVLQRIMNYEAVGRSQEFEKNKLKRKIRLYVKTELYAQAQQTLSAEKFLIITGEPGSGKTSLAEMLLYEYIGNDYELTYALDITEIGKQLRNDESKQVFYYDDFLGHNKIEIEKAKGSENHLVHILHRIKSSKNKFLIFTTRTFILRDAVNGSEKLDRLNIFRTENIIKLKDYDEKLKEKILDNHVQESELPNEYKQVFKDINLRDFIVHHRNFYPRSVEFITSNEYHQTDSPVSFVAYIYKNFNSPEKIWKHAYSQQINDYDRFLLSTMLSFGSSVSVEMLKIAFENRLAYEIKHNHIARTYNTFSSSFQRLLGGFIVYEYFEESEHLTFINPSLMDFLINHLREDTSEVVRIAESVVFPTQLTSRLFPIPHKKKDVQLPAFLLQRFKDNCSDFNLHSDSDKAKMAMILVTYGDIDDYEIRQSVVNLLLGITDWLNLSPEFDTMDTVEKILSGEVKFPKELINEIGVKMYAPIIVFLYDFEKILEKGREMSIRYGFDFKQLFLIQYPWASHFEEILNADIHESTQKIQQGDMLATTLDGQIRKLIKFRDRIRDWGFECNIEIFHLQALSDQDNVYD